jgi:DMSO/TMAO reductase YedYZ molybdopterin-dependent catalytic subunit
MKRHTRAGVVRAALFLALLSILSVGWRALAQGTAPSPTLKIDGNVATPLELSLADLKSMPRQTLKVFNPHEKKTEVYQGVPLQELFRRAGVPHGEQLRGALMTTYVLATASDGYRVVFSLAELDPGIQDSDVIVADTLNGAALGPGQGPLKLVAPRDKRPARWIRMLKSLTLLQPPK